jgi:uncharacterized protein (TIGR02646 family)
VIKIDKASKPIPKSLNSDLTNQRRQEVIDNYPNGYIDGSIYNSRYKCDDIKTALENLYLNKCAYCETRNEGWDVEHFRPKSIYYWLVYSWDNLLFACSTCNGFKNNHFEVLANRVEYQEADLLSIHNLMESYNKRENNLFFNPELEDPEQKIRFEKNGKILSDDDKLNYTIEKCKLNRTNLIFARAKLWKDLTNRIKTRYIEYQNTKENDLRIKNKASMEDFIEDSKNPENEFLAYRRYIVKHFLNEK